MVGAKDKVLQADLLLELRAKVVAVEVLWAVKDRRLVLAMAAPA